jgi:hypothetical protein
MSPLAFHQLIAKGVGRNFATSVDVKEDFLCFGISADSFCAEVVLAGYEPEPNNQAVKVTLWPSDLEGYYLNFAHLSQNEILFLCHILTQSVEWGSITHTEYDTGYVYLSIYACLDTDVEDIETMNSSYADGSRLLRGLSRLCREAEMLYPVLYGIATRQIEDITHIEKFFLKEDEVAH